MKINIYLSFFRGIAGGYKVIYQYSNYLVKMGHDVTIYYDLKQGINKRHIPKKIVLILRKILLLKYPQYYKLNKKVKQIGINTINNNNVEDADISIFTSPLTAHSHNKLDSSKGKQVYFIQGYENWDNSDEYVQETYKYGMKNIVISQWLKDIVDKYSESESIIVKNGIDTDIFKIINPIKNRNEYSIAMIYHTDELKGTKYGLEALCSLKRLYPQLEVNMFGNSKRPKEMPDWINYTHKANEEKVVEILNNSSIFICTSLFEGFGLPGLEAMSCGCALVTTDCFGPLEYVNENNGIVCKKGSSDEIFNATRRILEDKELKDKIVKNGLNTIENWNINISQQKFEQEILLTK